MLTQWFTKKPNEEKQGPFSNGELRQRAASGALQPSDLVWREGMSNAVPAHNLQGLFPAPQPLPSATSDLNSFLDNLVAASQSATEYTPGQSSYTPRAAAPVEKEEDVFSWYRPGDSRAPLLVNWQGFWQMVHALGSKVKAVYFLLPLVIALPLGVVLGAITSFIPFVFINWIILGAVGIGFGEVIFQCFRLAGQNKLLSIGYGLLMGLVVVYFYLAGGLYTDYNRYVGKDGPGISLVQAAQPRSVIWYVNLKTQTMVVGKYPSQLRDGRPNRFLNYGLVLFELGFILLAVGSGASGGRQGGQHRYSDDG